MLRRSCLLAILLLLALSLAGCGGDDDDDNGHHADDDAVDDDAVDDDAADDDQTDDDTVDDDAADDDTTPLDPVTLVNPLVGTGGFLYGYSGAYPGPKTPGSLVSVGPDTTTHGINIGQQHFSGYYYPDTMIRGFSHTRMHGTGAPDLCSLLVMPTTKMPRTPIDEAGFRSAYSHANEIARAGYYSVKLDDSGVFAELANTDLAAIHRYTYPDGDTPYVIVYPSHSIEPGWVKNAEVHIDAAQHTVRGVIDLQGPMTGRYGGVLVYYAMEFSADFADYGTWKDGQPTAHQTDETGADIGAYLSFASRRAPLLVKVGLSYQSLDQAVANLAAQIPAWDFDGAVQAARDRWRDTLGKIEIRGGTKTQQRIFYTSLYHAYLDPTDFTEANNQYVGFDKQAHDAGARRYYTDLSLWDTFRTEHPLLNLIDPTRSADIMQSMTLMYEQGGGIPKWALLYGDTGSMIGTSADIAFADAFVKGVRDWDYQTAYEGCYAHATGPVAVSGREDIEDYLNVHWICEDHESRGTSIILEFADEDAALSSWAAAMGLSADADMFLTHSKYYKNHFDPKTHFLRARNCDGSWAMPFYPEYPFSEQYVEGDAWHWTFYAPRDPQGLIDLFGGDKPFVDALDWAFDKEYSETLDLNWLPDLYFWFGNEVSIFHVFMFTFAGRPDLTQKYARWILGEYFRDDPDGLDGNDDMGAYSSWYVFASLGFFPVAGSDQYVITSPLFDGATLHLDGGELVMTAQNNSADNMYVQSVTINGEPLATPFFTHDQIVHGGTIDFVMGPFPSLWGRAQ